MTSTTPSSPPRESRIRQYRDLWDVPRMFLVEEGGHTLLFDCPFDDTREDYAREYVVYRMPSLSDADLEKPWAELPARAIRRLGTVPVADVSFGIEVLRTSLSRVTVERFSPTVQDG